LHCSAGSAHSRPSFQGISEGSSYAAVLFGLVGIVFGFAGGAVSRGERRSGAIGLVAAIVGIALPILFLIALIVAFSRFE
jgi:hypothetical protein